MNKVDFLNKIAEIVEEEKNSLEESTKLAEITGLDSFATLSIVALIDEEFNEIVDAEDISKANDISDIMNLIGKDKFL